MFTTTGRGTDAVADTGNEKARRAGTRRAVFVALPADPLAPASYGQTSVTASPGRGFRPTPMRCMDGIDSLPRRP